MPKTKQKSTQGFAASIADEMLKLATAGFGLVAALAWNNAVQTFIEDYIKPYIGGSSSLASQVIYAVVITLLAVTITYQLTVIKRKLSNQSTK